MRFMHLADLHIGKRLNGYSMIEDQRFVLKQVLQQVSKEQLDGVLIAGDVYDKPIPSSEAVQLLDWFLTQLSKQNIPVYMISGNHDSGERLSFAGDILKKNHIFVSAIYDGTLEHIVVRDAHGPLHIYLLPFVKPIHVRKALESQLMQEESDVIFSYDDAVSQVLKRANIDAKARNILVAHQFVTGATRCESEEIAVGGLDNISAGLFDAFDYVALGHIHGPQRIERESIRYAGTLLKYSFSECEHKKSITIVDIKEKGNVTIEEILITPLHDMNVLKEEYKTLMSPAYYQKLNPLDYVKIVLTDRENVLEAVGKLRTVYPNIMALEYENRSGNISTPMERNPDMDNKTPIDYVREFYENRNNEPLNQQQEKMVLETVKEIWG